MESLLSRRLFCSVPSQIVLHASHAARSPRRVVIHHKPSSPPLDLFKGLNDGLGGFVCFVALRPKSTAMVIAGRSVHLITLFPGQA